MIWGFLAATALRYSGTLAATLGGEYLPKNSPSSFCFSGVSGGNLEMGNGAPSNQSGMKTRYFCASSEVARMSAPCSVCGKYPKIS